jgi:hypothetical protein
MTIEGDEWTASSKGGMIEIRRCPCGSPEAYLLVANQTRDFSLRLNRPHGEEVMALQFISEGRKRRKFRKVTAHLFADGITRRLESARPTLGPLADWSLDLGKRFSIPSKKNARLEGGNAGPVYIRKYRKGGLEIQTSDSRITPLCLFALSIASFVARK